MHSFKNIKFEHLVEITHDPDMWDRLLEELPEGSELVCDERGQVIGVEIKLVCMFHEDDQDKPSSAHNHRANGAGLRDKQAQECDNSLSNRENNLFKTR